MVARHWLERWLDCLCLHIGHTGALLLLLLQLLASGSGEQSVVVVVAGGDRKVGR